MDPHLLIAPLRIPLSSRVSLQLGGHHGEEELVLRAGDRDALLLNPAFRLAVRSEEQRRGTASMRDWSTF